MNEELEKILEKADNFQYDEQVKQNNRNTTPRSSLFLP